MSTEASQERRLTAHVQRDYDRCPPRACGSVFSVQSRSRCDGPIRQISSRSHVPELPGLTFVGSRCRRRSGWALARCSHGLHRLQWFRSSPSVRPERPRGASPSSLQATAPYVILRPDPSFRSVERGPPRRTSSPPSARAEEMFRGIIVGIACRKDGCVARFRSVVPPRLGIVLRDPYGCTSTPSRIGDVGRRSNTGRRKKNDGCGEPRMACGTTRGECRKTAPRRTTFRKLGRPGADGVGVRPGGERLRTENVMAGSGYRLDHHDFIEPELTSGRVAQARWA